ncbi:DUF5329 family protein [Cupriavidus necator]
MLSRTLTPRTQCLALLLGLGTALCAHAGKTDPVTQAEIQSLLNRLETSSCQFHRNGNWYPGSQAKSHLLGKLRHIEDRTTLRNTEQFIALAATRSSLSNQPYQVKCGASRPEHSAQWLTRELQAIRAQRR